MIRLQGVGGSGTPIVHLVYKEETVNISFALYDTGLLIMAIRRQHNIEPE